MRSSDMASETVLPAQGETPAPAAPAKKKWLTRGRLRTAKFFLFISPWLTGLVLFSLAPMILSLVLSFTWGTKIATWTSKDLIFSFRNYAYIFTQDKIFLRSILNTFLYAFMRVMGGLLFALLLAVLYNHDLFGKKLYRTMAYSVSLIPVAAASSIWILLLKGDSSLVQRMLAEIGIHNFDLFSKSTALVTVVSLDIFCGLGSTMIVILAALQGVPKELEEAAMIDGAGRVRRFWTITVPMISSALMFASVTGFIGALQTYAKVQLLTGGDPEYTTMTMTMSVLSRYKATNGNLALGYACAEAWVIFVIIMIFTLIYLKLLNRKVYYGDE